MARAKPKTTADNSVDVAVLQTQMQAVGDDLVEIKDALKALANRFEDVNDSMTKYKGMVGGLMLAASAVVTVLTLFKGAVVAWFASSAAPKA